jgi:hypothetical protein
VWQCEWQCVAVQVAALVVVCGSAAVFDSARSSVRQCAAVHQCMCGRAAERQSGSVRQCERQ